MNFIDFCSWDKIETLKERLDKFWFKENSGDATEFVGLRKSDFEIHI